MYHPVLSGNIPPLSSTIHQEKMVGTFYGRIKFSAIVVGHWERKPECLRGNLFSNSTVRTRGIKISSTVQIETAPSVIRDCT